MSDNKKYYYLKIKESFFDDDRIKIIESMDNGIYYSNLLLKLYLKSLKNDGALRFTNTIPYNEKMIATVTNLNIDVVRSGLKMLIELQFIDKLDDGTLYMSEIQNYIGNSSSEADRKRRYRSEIEDEKNKIGTNVPQILDKCLTNVGQTSDKNPPELERELELEKEKEYSAEELCLNDFFEEIWKLYPDKRGKYSIKEKKKKELQEVGFEKISIAIERYIKDVELRRIDFQELSYKNGSTFFNTAYMDYLDDDFEFYKTKEEQSKILKEANRKPERNLRVVYD
jgi:predicted phage replisome organizer